MQHKNREGLWFVSAYVCVCVRVCFVCLHGRLCPFAFLHVNLIMAKQRGDMLREQEREMEEMSKERWKKRGGFWCREKKKKTIPARRFPWQQWHHWRSCLFGFWWSLQRSHLSIHTYECVWFFLVCVNMRAYLHTWIVYERNQRDKPPQVQSVRGYPLLPGNSSHGNKLKHDLALLSQRRGWGEILWAPPRYKWVQILKMFHMARGH